MGTIIIIILLAIIVHLLLMNLGKKTVSKVQQIEQEKAIQHGKQETKFIKKVLEDYFLSLKATDLLKVGLDKDLEGGEEALLCYLIRKVTKNSTAKVENDFKEELKFVLEKNNIFINTWQTKKHTGGNYTTEYLKFYDNNNCGLVITVLTDDKFSNPPSHGITVSLLGTKEKKTTVTNNKYFYEKLKLMNAVDNFIEEENKSFKDFEKEGEKEFVSKIMVKRKEELDQYYTSYEIYPLEEDMNEVPIEVKAGVYTEDLIYEFTEYLQSKGYKVTEETEIPEEYEKKLECVLKIGIWAKITFIQDIFGDTYFLILKIEEE